MTIFKKASKSRLALLFYLKRIHPHLSQDEQETASLILEKSRVVPARRAWLEHIMELHPEVAQPILTRDLVSPSKSLRDFARYHLSRLAPLDFKEHYQQLLDAEIDETGALSGLMEVCPERAHEEALKRMDSHMPGLRTTAILSLSDAWVETNLPWFLSAKGWSSPSIWHATRKRLGRIPRQLGIFLLEASGKLDFPQAVTLYLFSQAPHFRKWDGLEYLLTMAAHPLLSKDAVETLYPWIYNEGHSFVHLSSDHKARLFLLLGHSNLPSEMKERLHFILEKAE